MLMGWVLAFLISVGSGVLLVPSILSPGENLPADRSRTAIESGLGGTIDLFRAHVGRYPTTQEGLAVLIAPPSDTRLALKWQGPYVKDESKLLDAWGQALEYRCPGVRHPKAFDLASSGPDGVFGTGDDIGN